MFLESIYVHLEKKVGESPDICMQTCGDDPHMCTYISSFEKRASAIKGGISDCKDLKVPGSELKSMSPLRNPCTFCWYSIIVTAENSRSRFQITLGADGVAQPLVAGESFKGYVDKDMSKPVTLVYYLSSETLQAHVKGIGEVKRRATMRIAMTPVFGDPFFRIIKFNQSQFPENMVKSFKGSATSPLEGATVHPGKECWTEYGCVAEGDNPCMQCGGADWYCCSATKSYPSHSRCHHDWAEYYSNASNHRCVNAKADVLFDSQKTGRHDYELKFTNETGEEVVGAYYIFLWAESMHSSYRMQVFWENPLEAGSLATEATMDGLPYLEDGRLVRGALEKGQPDVYLFRPSQTDGSDAALKNPDITVSIAPLDQYPVHVAAIAVKPGMNSQAIFNAILQRGDVELASEYPRTWKSLGDI
jgi:hypothetical protein